MPKWSRVRLLGRLLGCKGTIEGREEKKKKQAELVRWKKTTTLILPYDLKIVIKSPQKKKNIKGLK